MSIREFVSILRCRSWNVWPELQFIEHRDFRIKYGQSDGLPARLAVLSYHPKSPSDNADAVDTKRGPKIWSGESIGPHPIWGGTMAPAEEMFSLGTTHRSTYRGEIDISINFRFDLVDSDDLPPELIDAVKVTSYSIMALLNVRIKDFIVPNAPFQVREVLAEAKGAYSVKVNVITEDWKSIAVDEAQAELDSAAALLMNSDRGDKLQTALELYAAHFNEQQIRVRFLLLVISMEVLAPSTEKHQVVLDLLGRWKHELRDAKSQFDSDSEEFKSFEALSRELNFRSEDSIRSQIRKLFAGVPCDTPGESTALQRRALKVYDKRSTLVHEGYLPSAELVDLENEARGLLELLFVNAT